MDDILKDLSWAAKLKLLKEIPIEVLDPARTTTTPSPYEGKPHLLQDLNAERSRPRNVGMESLQLREQIQNMTIASEVKDFVDERKPTEDDENHIRLKLFRLMYETVRDNDLKAKRADIIKEFYKNITNFEIGVLMGDIQEKFNTIVDTQETLKKFYDIWKPIEHVNAYEQIINQAMEISQLIDLVRLHSRQKYHNMPPAVSTAKTASYFPASSASYSPASTASYSPDSSASISSPSSPNFLRHGGVDDEDGPVPPPIFYTPDYGGLPHGKW